MKLHPIIAAAAIAVLTAPVRPMAAQDTDRAKILATVQSVFDAMRTRDTALLTRVFDTTARLVGVNTRTTPPTITTRTAAQFGAGFVNAPAGSVANERIFDPEIRIDGDLAQVWAYYTFRRNSTFNHCGVDAFMLMKVGADWKITQLADSRRTEGCTHTEPLPPL